MTQEMKQPAKKPAGACQSPEPTFTKSQLVKSKTLGLPKDAIMVVLEDGKLYTKDQAESLVIDFLERKV
ncbi:hypothetical protein [Anaeromassilibacillus senegalensis]|uniref:hypothetical protein n=1 Tax=Anaeromassilibacillus senegalensis TaxID=1673717 RepID=UPI0006811581|nr:hypothetical protein [Anaeromassilibacillus senegalensis]